MSDQKNLISPQEYFELLEKLVYEGKGYGKTTEVCARLLQPLDILTQTSDGLEETRNKINVDPIYICFDPKDPKFDTLEKRNTAMEELGSNWIKKIIGERDISRPDYMGAGIWASKKSKFEDDYTLPPKNGEGQYASDAFIPNPNAVRVALTLDEKTLGDRKTITMVAPWGTETVALGAALATREKPEEFKPLIKAIEKIRRGEATYDILFRKDKDGNTVAAFDVYPMEGPTEKNKFKSFLDANYKLKDLQDSTLKMRADSLEQFTSFHKAQKEVGQSAQAAPDALSKSTTPMEKTRIPLPLTLVFTPVNADTFETQNLNGKSAPIFDFLRSEGINPNAHTRARDIAPEFYPFDHFNDEAVYVKDDRLIVDISVVNKLQEKYDVQIAKRPLPLDVAFVQVDPFTYKSVEVASEPSVLEKTTNALALRLGLNQKPTKTEEFFLLLRKEGIDPDAETNVSRAMYVKDLRTFSGKDREMACAAVLVSDIDNSLLCDKSVIDTLRKKYTFDVTDFPTQIVGVKHTPSYPAATC